MKICGIKLGLRQSTPQGRISFANRERDKEETKNGYVQVKYTWKKGEYSYTSRWHTRTPNAPKEQGDSWVVQWLFGS